jgi:hypothetical protein
MISLSLFILSFFLVIFQTTVSIEVLNMNQFYDLLIPIFIYIGLYRSVVEGFFFSVFFGFLMDSYSGVPFGLYISIYFWLFIGIKKLVLFLHAENFILLIFIMTAAVFFENMFFFLIIAFMEHNHSVFISGLNRVVFQIIFAVVTGPFFLLLLGRYEKIISELITNRKLNKDEKHVLDSFF